MPREWVIHDYSGYQGLTLQACDEQEPGPGEIRLRVEAFALNWGDMNLMRDMYSFSFHRLPARIGMEAAGIASLWIDEDHDATVTAGILASSTTPAAVGTAWCAPAA